MDLKIWQYHPRWQLEKSKAGVRSVPSYFRRMEKETGARSNGRREGAINEPPETAAGPGASEMAIYEKFAFLQQDTTENYTRHFHEHKALESKAEEAMNEDRLSGCVVAVERNFREKLEDISAGIEEPWERLRRAKANLARFAEFNRITRDPENFDGRFLKGATLAVIVMGESALNANMFAEASDFGLIGGLKESVIISAANVLFSGGAGFLMRFSNARPIAMRRIGTAARLVWLPAVAFLHGAVGHYRDLLAEGAANAEQMVLPHMLANPLDLSFHSGLLMGLGFIASVVAVFEGYRMDDSVPQFGKHARQVANAKAEYTALKEEILGDLRDMADEGRDAVERGYAEAKAALAAYEDELRETVDILRHYERMTRYTISSCVRLVNIYRQANSEERSERPAAYFNDPVVPPFKMDETLAHELTQAQGFLDGFEPVRILHDLQAGMQEAVKQIDALAERYRGEVLALFERIENRAE